MPQEWTDTVELNHPWDIVVQAAYRKYPNPFSPHVQTLDTLERVVTDKNLYSNRLFTTHWNVPSLVLKIIGSNTTMYINEQSLCDLNTKTLVIRARNISLNNLFCLDEKLVYSINPKNPETTILTQTAKIHVFGIPWLGGVLENLLISNYGSTVSKGRAGLNFVADSIKHDQA